MLRPRSFMISVFQIYILLSTSLSNAFLYHHRPARSSILDLPHSIAFVQTKDTFLKNPITCNIFVAQNNRRTCPRRKMSINDDVSTQTKTSSQISVGIEETSTATDNVGNSIALNLIGTKNEPTSTTTTTTTSSTSIDWEMIQKELIDESKEIIDCISLITRTLFLNNTKSSSATLVQEIMQLCDEIDLNNDKQPLIVSGKKVTRFLRIRQKTFEYIRYEKLVQLMQRDYETYVTTAAFLCPNRITRQQLPNVQDVPYNTQPGTILTTTTFNNNNQQGDDILVADCELEKMKYQDSLLDQLLLYLFRKLVTQNTGGLTSEQPGITGLLEQGRNFMLQPNQTAEAQHTMVYNTLGGLMTPYLPPFYRIFMSGIVPQKLGTPYDGKQYGPWFYAPFLTSFVTPLFFHFLVGPSTINRRKNGQMGGLLVEKCKFLQESNCKGLCLNQCKVPAQSFFQNELGLPLTVVPNFVTQECQWNFGEIPLPVQEDPSFPKGCLSGCESRKVLATRTSQLSSSSNLCM